MTTNFRGKTLLSFINLLFLEVVVSNIKVCLEVVVSNIKVCLEVVVSNIKANVYIECSGTYSHIIYHTG